MKLNFIREFLARLAAKQLRKPGGLLAGKVGSEMNKANENLYDLTVSEMQLSDDESILEIGFGNGKFFDKIFSAANNLNIAGLDFSPEMVKAAKTNNEAAVNVGKLVLRMGSSDKIPFPDNSFDKIFCINVVYFWEQPAEHLKEIFRVLKPGGIFYTTIRAKQSMAEMPFTKYGFLTYTKDEWVRVLEINDFNFVHVQENRNRSDAALDNENAKFMCIAAKKRE